MNDTTAPKADMTTRAADRALALLSVVCEAGLIGLGDAAKAAGLSSSTALRLLRTLESTDFVQRDENGGYRPGSKIIRLGVQALSHESLVGASKDAMTKIVEQTGESVYLSIPASRHEGLYVAIVEGTHSVRHANWVGRRFPLASSAAGQALEGIVDESQYTVVGDGVERDITAIAAPIRVGGKVVGALSVVVPSYRVTSAVVERVGNLLVDHTSNLYK